MNIVVTGSRKGIGLAIVKYYTELGHNVIGCSRNKSEFEHPNYKHYCVNLENEKEIFEFARDVKKKYGYIDALINNAGIASMNHFVTTPLEIAEKLMRINYLGSFSCTRAFLNCLKKSNHPRVVNFTTVAVPFNLDGELSYAASKAAIETMTKILAKELSMFNITVNAVGPAPIKTDLIEKVPQDRLELILKQQGIHRFGEFEDVINVIDFYINERSDFVSGQIIYLGGVSK